MTRMQWDKLLSDRRYYGPGEEPKSDAEQGKQDVRNSYLKDADRIIFSSAFRRLQGKAQVFPFPNTDFIRTRLTHTLEASQVGRTLGQAIGRELLLSSSAYKDRYPELFAKEKIDGQDVAKFNGSQFGNIVAAASLAHDIGNPPFGHAGEDAIRLWFRHQKRGCLVQPLTLEQSADLKHFEGNAQGFRTITKLQGNKGRGGLNLTCATLASFMKYPRPSIKKEKDGEFTAHDKFGYFSDDTQAFEVVAKEAGLLTLHTSEKGTSHPTTAYARHPFAFLVEAADDICYRISDLEDASKHRIVERQRALDVLEDLCKTDPNNDLSPLSTAKSFDERLSFLRAKAIGTLIGQAKTVFIENLDSIMSGTFNDPTDETRGRNILEFIAAKQQMKEIKALMVDDVFITRAKIELELMGSSIIGSLLGLYSDAFEQAEILLKQNQIETFERKNLTHVPTMAGRAIQYIPDYDETPVARYAWLLRITDYLAGMSDDYILSQYRKLIGGDVNRLMS